MCCKRSATLGPVVHNRRPLYIELEAGQLLFAVHYSFLFQTNYYTIIHKKYAIIYDDSDVES